MFTGHKDTDFIILSKLSDYELGKFCQTNKYIQSLCKDDVFWRNRTIQKFEKYLGDAERINEYRIQYGYNNWRLYYISLINEIDSEKCYKRKNDRNDIEKLCDVYKKFQYELLNNFDKYNWKSILGEELKNFASYKDITILGNLKKQEEYLDYLLENENFIPNNYFLEFLIELHGDKNGMLIEKALKNYKISSKEVIKTIINFLEFAYDRNNLKAFSKLLDYIKDNNKIEELIETIENFEYEDEDDEDDFDSDLLAYIISYLNVNIVRKNK